MKKLCVVVSLIICLTMAACSNTEEKTNSEVQELTIYNATFNIECAENLLFSRYDVNVLVDSKEIATLEHGSQDTYNIELTEGEHTISFEKEDDSSVDGNVKFDISSDTSLRFKISCSSDQIKVEKLESDSKKSEDETDEAEVKNTETEKEEPVLSETQAKIPQSSSMYSSDNYKEVIEELKQAGFTNIKTEIVYNVGTGWWDSLSKDAIETISVNGKTDFKEGEIFERNCEIIIKYCDFEINDPSIQYNQYSVAKLIQDLESNAMNAKDTHMNEYVQITGRIDSIDASGKNFYLYPTNDQWAIQGVLCDIQTDEQKEKLKTFVAGNKITVRGKITLVGEVLGYSMDVYSFQ